MGRERASAAMLALCLLGAATPELVAKGKRLFTGDVALEARMVGHTQVLPLEAIRCTNCHQLERDPPRAPSENFGPPLGPEGLAKKRPRRGGPASVYDAKSLCKLLRDGIDPAYVMIPQTMPRYVMSDADCEALWTFLVTP